jgi:predicted DNA-binding transcriptional regulator AlpA
MTTKSKRSFAAANQARKSKNPPLPTATDLTDSQVRLISKAEVIERTHLTFVSIWRLMIAGTFPPARKVGGKSLWIEAEIDAWIKALPVREYKTDNEFA